MKNLPLLCCAFILSLIVIASVNPSTAAVITTDTSIGALDTTFDGQDIVVSNCTVTIDGTHAFNSFQLAQGGILTHTSTNDGLSLTISNDFQIEPGGAIQLSGRGFAGNTGTGNGGAAGGPQSGAGAGHAGYGGMSSSNAPGGNCYGVFDEPVTLGSGGGPGVGGVGGAGGGAIKLVIGGTALIDGGVFANGANATNSRSGGGSGGSIWITAQTISGSGAITTDGGNGESIHGGGGGGGRIAIVWETNLFTGVMTAFGGFGWKTGGAGTVFTKSGEDNGLVVLDNAGRTGTNSMVAITNQVNVVVRGAASIIPEALNAGNLVLASNSFVFPSSSTIFMRVAGICVVEAGAGLVVTGKGSAPGQGQGAGGSVGTTGGGGGHGGRGGMPTNVFSGGGEHGAESGPNRLGSGGGGANSIGGFGGGWVNLTVNGNLQLDGTIAADGTAATSGSGGGGSGGSVSLSVGTLSGTGAITANGGNGLAAGGGGAGGRIAIYYSTNSFAGNIAAFGGSGSQAGGAGTIFMRQSNNAPALILDNNGQAGATTTFGGTFNTGYDSLTIANGSRAQIADTLSLLSVRDLLIASNAWLFPRNKPLKVTRNLTVEATSGIDVDRASTSSGGNGFLFGGGAGHGGFGGVALGFPNSGGSPYGAADHPTQGGSHGGPAAPGSMDSRGLGGGVVFINGGSVMKVDGVITANGGDGLASTYGPNYTGGGGGSGGSILILAGSLSGSGRISANGGAGVNGGGGGAGGRVALRCNTNTFAGTLSAYGGAGYVAGGAGTIYFSLYSGSLTLRHVLVDNNNQSGMNTFFGGQVSSMTVQNGGRAALAYTGQTYTYSDIVIHSNGWLAVANQAIMATNITVDAGGGIVADGQGTANNGGFGSGNRGAGHGGYGARGTNIAIAGGAAYGSITQPTNSGSYVSAMVPSPGGGGIKLNVSGTLSLNGRVSADAGSVSTLGNGGGSGGSVWLNVGTLTGSGLISASGGDCVNGGGGGGGRIAVYYNTNSFTGTMSVRGGTGFNHGGAGTIYRRKNSAPVGELLVDGGGVMGELTPLATNYSLPNLPFDLTVIGGASVLPIAPVPTLSNLWIGANSTLTMRTNETNLFLHVLRDVTITTGSTIQVDGKGFTQGIGPAPGASLANTGAGGGYGGAGGNSAAGAGGGTSYGSAAQPAERGSGGGAGANGYFGGSEGGGSIQMIVGGTLTLDGALTANGNAGLQDDSGGGAGGSIWVSAGILTGTGNISAVGGNGDLFGGGGGGGGRIAIYSPSNSFTGAITVSGGSGANPGEAGSLFIATNLFTYLISGTVTNLQGVPQSDVSVQASGLASVLTDGNGHYELSAPMGWSGTVTPSADPNVVVPGKRSYGSLYSDQTNVHFLVVQSVTPTLTSGLSETNMVLNWTGIPGVSYRAYWSTNLTHWTQMGSSIPGENGAMQLLIPANDLPQKFVRLQASY